MMENSSTIQADLEATGKNLRQTMKMGWLVSSRLVIHLSIQMGGLSSFLRTNTLTHGKRSFQRSSALVSSLMEVGLFRQRWATGLVRYHRLRWRLLSGWSVKNGQRMHGQGGTILFLKRCRKTSFKACGTSGMRVFVVQTLYGPRRVR